MKKLILIIMLLAMSSLTAQEITEGVLVFEYGDSVSGTESYENFYIQSHNKKIKLNASEAFKSRTPLYLWSGNRVAVSFAQKNLLADGSQAIKSIELLEGEAQRGGITGSQKWVSLLCKFNDVDAEPRNEAFFDGMYANTAAGLDDYWRELSYDQANIAGSVAFDWVELPSSRDTYVVETDDGPDADLDLLFDDCTATAINVHGALDINDGFVGINMMFNDVLDCCAWGGGRYEGLDGGPDRLWRVTWNPPWAFANEAVIAHEMGHGFGLPHANNSDGDNDPYDSPWDVMSAAQSNAVTDSTYGRLGKHINMYYKYILGWVDDGDGEVIEPFSEQVVRIDNTARATTNQQRFARIPLFDGTQYFVEARKREGDYDGNVESNAVIIHHVDNSRREPPWVMDKDVPAANFSDNEGVMWKVGETFQDPIDGASVRVTTVTTHGFRLIITGSDVIFRAGLQD